MSLPTLKMTLRLRLLFAASAGFGLIAVLLGVGALFPAVGHAIGKLSIPKGVDQLLGGADYGTITGWYRSEVGSIYGPLLIAAVAIISASALSLIHISDAVEELIKHELVSEVEERVGRQHRHRACLLYTSRCV